MQRPGCIMHFSGSKHRAERVICAPKARSTCQRNLTENAPPAPSPTRKVHFESFKNAKYVEKKTFIFETYVGETSFQPLGQFISDLKERFVYKVSTSRSRVRRPSFRRPNSQQNPVKPANVIIKNAHISSINI